MDTKFLTIGLLITATLFILGSGCGKDKNSSKPCSGGRYSFMATSEFSPQKEVYNVGDTIFLNSILSKTLFDNASNQNIDYSNSLGIGGTLTFGYMDTITHIGIDAYSKFATIPLVGTVSQITTVPEKGVNSKYQEGVNYQFKLAIKLTQKGLYVLGVTDLGSQGIAGKDCTNAGFAMTVTNTNKNINLFQYALNYTPDAMLQKSIYCFKVQ
jgi:hypothetical protein